jgi:ElaA protein
MQSTFYWARLEQLDAQQFHEIILNRERVFVVEQQRACQDADAYDRVSWHLTCRLDGTLAAYLRIVDPGHKYPEPSIGRVLTVSQYRGIGLGKALLKHAIAGAAEYYPDQAIRISAQSHLHHFYSSYGFQAVSEEYLEENIPHIEMLRPFKASTQP